MTALLNSTESKQEPKPQDHLTEMAQKTKLFWWLALVSYVLLTLLMIWHITRYPLPKLSALYLVAPLSWSEKLQLFSEVISNTLRYIALFIPLLLPLKGMARKNPYTHAWANIVLMIYMLHSVMLLMTSIHDRQFALIELLLVSLAFIGNSFFARYRGKELGFKLRRKGLIK